MRLWEKNIRQVVPYVPGEQPAGDKIEKLNTNNEFKSKINRFVLDVVHRSALKGEDVILELARKFLEGLTDKQLNELVYDKVETDMIWIRLNGSIVGGIIGFFAFWLLQLVNN